MLIDIIFPTKNRLEFTKASVEALVKNTDWQYVRRVYIYDDGSTDGTSEFLIGESLLGTLFPIKATVISGSRFGGPSRVMQDYILKGLRNKDYPPLFAKIDNDVIVPPGWLTRCVSTMINHSELELLGIEPPLSRTPHYKGGRPSPQPEIEATGMYAPCDSIGGIGMMRRSCFERFPDLSQHSIYGGFTEWQLNHKEIIKGWIVPPLDVILLDRLPIEPWATLSKQYIAKGWQREWSSYDPAKPFWQWWLEPEDKCSVCENQACSNCKPQWPLA